MHSRISKVYVILEIEDKKTIYYHYYYYSKPYSVNIFFIKIHTSTRIYIQYYIHYTHIRIHKWWVQITFTIFCFVRYESKERSKIKKIVYFRNTALYSPMQSP